MVELTAKQAENAAKAADALSSDIVFEVAGMFIKASKEQFEYIEDNGLRIPTFCGIPVYYVIEAGENESE